MSTGMENTYQFHAAAAVAVAGQDYAGLARLQLTEPAKGELPKPPKELFEKIPAGPLQLFDNLYYVGYEGTGAFVLTTSGGIILIDALEDDHDAEHAIVGGMEKLGLDPKEIKYVLLTHGHGDHYGGAAYIQQKFGARVLMHEIDWDFMENAPPVGANGLNFPKPQRDMLVTDGQQLTLGDTTITVVFTPGHTPGGISLIIPVWDNGQQHMAAQWGGSGFPPSLEMKKVYLQSLDRFSVHTKAAKVDAKINSHPFADDSLVCMAGLRNRKAGEANPFVIGYDNYLRYEDVYRECIKASIAKMEQEE